MSKLIKLSGHEYKRRLLLKEKALEEQRDTFFKTIAETQDDSSISISTMEVTPKMWTLVMYWRRQTV